MNGYRRHISKAFLLLAVVMLPAQQLIAATCCCRHRDGRVLGPAGSCCTNSQAKCSKRVSKTGDLRCNKSGQLKSGAKPCQCPTGGCGKFALTPADIATVESSLTDELAGGFFARIEVETADFVGQPLAMGPFSSSRRDDSQLCVLFCRYLL